MVQHAEYGCASLNVSQCELCCFVTDMDLLSISSISQASCCYCFISSGSHSLVQGLYVGTERWIITYPAIFKPVCETDKCCLMSLKQATFSLGSPTSCGRKDLYFPLFSIFIHGQGFIAYDTFK